MDDGREEPQVKSTTQLVSFGTSGHRGSALSGSFNKAHILAMTQAICEYRRGRGIDGPVQFSVGEPFRFQADKGLPVTSAVTRELKEAMPLAERHPCPVCGHWHERRHPSNAARQRAYRQRKRGLANG